MIDKLFHKINNLPHDKLLHFVGGLFIFAAFAWSSVLVACALVIVAAVGKEVYDYRNRHKHTPDVIDALATIAGGGVGLFIKLT